MTINSLVNTAHCAAVKKGFYESDRNIGELLMLIVSELGEALEAHRGEKFADWDIFDSDCELDMEELRADAPEKYKIEIRNNCFKLFIKDRFEDELADVFIRLADLCGYMGIDIEKHIKAKMFYNQSRPEKHGKEY